MSLMAYYAAVAASGGGSIIDSLTWAVDISAARPADYTVDGSGQVSAWGPFLQATAAAQPLLDADGLAAGYPALIFDGASDGMVASSFVWESANPWTIFIVHRPTALEQSDKPILGQNTNTIGSMFIQYRATNRNAVFANTAGGLRSVVTANGSLTSTSIGYLLTVWYDGASVIGIQHNQAPAVTDTGSAILASTIDAGLSSSYFAQRGAMGLSRVLVAQSLLDADDRAAVQAELQAEWGLTL